MPDGSSSGTLPRVAEQAYPSAPRCTIATPTETWTAGLFQDHLPKDLASDFLA
jgi:hypothetical protein